MYTNKLIEYDKVKSFCWAHNFFVDVVPTSKRHVFEIRVKGQRLKNTEDGGYYFKSKVGRKPVTELWDRVEVAYMNIYKRLKNKTK